MSKKVAQAQLKRISAKNDKQRLISEMSKDIREANRRLEKLERGAYTTPRRKKKGKYIKRENYEKFIGTYASKTLFKKLDTDVINAIKNNRVKINEKMTYTQLKGIQKRVKTFLRSKSSNISGIKSIREQTKRSLKATLTDSEDTSELTNEDIDNIYQIFQDTDFNDLTSYVPGSDIVFLISDIKEKNLSKDDFIEQLYLYSKSEDKEIGEIASRLYNKIKKIK